MIGRTTLAGWLGLLTLAALWQAKDVPPSVWLAATVPAVVWTLLVFGLARRAGDALAMVAALLAGAVVAAPTASHVNQALFDWLAQRGGEETARQVVPGMLAPVTEEVAKGLALVSSILLLRGRRVTILHGLAWGALIGVGFAWRENLQYLTLAAVQGGAAGLWKGLYLRGLLGGLHHAAFTAATGLGLAFALRGAVRAQRWSCVVVGLVLATAQHLVWNAVVAQTVTDLLCGAERVGGPCRPMPDAFALLVATPLLALAAVGPGIVAMALIARRLRGSGPDGCV